MNTSDEVSANLYDYVHDYIQRNPEYEDCNKKTYDLCIEYIYGGITPIRREKLVTLLSVQN